jgi:hypothetical protein
MKTDTDYHAQLLLRQNAFAGKTVLWEAEIEHIANISSPARVAIIEGRVLPGL